MRFATKKEFWSDYYTFYSEAVDTPWGMKCKYKNKNFPLKLSWRTWKTENSHYKLSTEYNNGEWQMTHRNKHEGPYATAPFYF